MRIRIVPAVVRTRLTIIALCGAAVLSPSPVAAQWQDDEELPSWQALNYEPDLQTVDGLVDPNGRLVRYGRTTVVVNYEGRARTFTSYEAIVFLLLRDYLQFTIVDGRRRLVPTRKYFAWLNAHPGTGLKVQQQGPAPPPPPVIPPSTSTAVTTVTLVLDPVEKARQESAYASRGERMDFMVDNATLVLTPTPGRVDVGAADLQPAQITHLTRWTMANGNWYEAKYEMRPRVGTFNAVPLQGGRASGPMTVYVYHRSFHVPNWQPFGNPTNDRWNAAMGRDGKWKLYLFGDWINVWVQP